MSVDLAGLNARIDVLDQQQSLQTEALRAVAKGDTDHLKAVLEALDPSHAWDGSPKAPAGTAPSPSPARLLSAIDTSSNNGLDIAPLLAQLRPDLVIVKSYQNIELGGRGARYTVTQAQAAKAAGAIPLPYVWLYDGSATGWGAAQATDSLATFAQSGQSTPILLLDCERYDADKSNPSPDVIDSALDETERRSLLAAIYTGLWWIDAYFPGGQDAFTARYAHRAVLWIADYSGRQPNLAAVPIPRGWPRERLAGHQFTDRPVDTSQFRSDLIGL